MGHKSVYRRRSSLVRKFVSLVPEFVWKYFMSSPPQIFFHPYILGKENKNISFSFSAEEDLNTSFTNFSSYLGLSNEKPDLLLISTPKSSHSVKRESRITVLQKELDMLKQQISKIMERYCEGSMALSTESVSSENNLFSVIPPPPPPPPPPLPVISKTPLPSNVSSKPKSIQRNSNIPLFGGDLLKDLDKVVLKKIEKSPGGGPKRRIKPTTDPGDFLQEVLRKRFLVVQDLTPEQASLTDVSDSYQKEQMNILPSAASE